MPEHLRALVVVTGIALLVFWIGRGQITHVAVGLADYNRRRNAWVAITVFAFAAHNFWVYSVGAGAVAAYAAIKDRNPLGAYAVFLFAVPPFGEFISGFGVVRVLFELTHVRLLGLVILLPLAVRLLDTRTQRPHGVLITDFFVAGYVILLAGLTFVTSSFTVTLRQIFLLFLDIWLPYYVASRVLQHRNRMRDFNASLVLVAAILAVTAMFELVKGWILYSSLDEILGVPWTYGSYLLRGEGLVRPSASTGHSIVLGYVIAVAICILFHIRGLVPSRQWFLIAVATLSGGLVAALARGPWLGALVGVAAGLSFGKGGLKRVSLLLLALAVLGGASLLTPLGDKWVNYLPFVGSVDASNVTYRQRLVEVSIQVLARNPLFGVYDFMNTSAMQEMRQGQGIIDIVNTYIGVALVSGLVGLGLFCGAFLAAILTIVRVMRRTGVAAVEAESLAIGRALLASIVCVMVIIATVSPILVVPTVYWLLIGAAAAYANQRQLAFKSSPHMPPRTVRSHSAVRHA